MRSHLALKTGIAALILVGLFITSLSSLGNQQYDLVVRNTRIVDGTGRPAFWGDIAVRNGRIIKVGTIASPKAHKVIDAKGQITAPGFIDIHTHVESIHQSPTAENFIRMGVTSVVTGNCGSSALDVGDFFDRIGNSPLTVNLGTLIGHNSVRYYVMHNERRSPTVTELAEMERLVEKGMYDGALGLSTGLIYVPGIYSDTNEIVALARVAAKHGGIYATHMRDEGADVVNAINEAVTVGEQAAIPVEISHFKLTSRRLWGETATVLDIVRDARRRGLRVGVDQYAYTASSTSLDVLLPDWAREGGREISSRRLEDLAVRNKVKIEMKTTLARNGYENYGYAVVGNYRPNTLLERRTIVEAAKEIRGDDTLDDQIEQILTMYADGGATMIYHKISEEDVMQIMVQPFTAIASDSGVRGLDENDSSLSHPRSFGNNARVLARYVRDLRILTLEEGVRKMTLLPAQVVGLNRRGAISEGFAADLVIFDDVRVKDMASYDKPKQSPEEINWVVVNGRVVLDGGLITGERPGVPLRRSQPGAWPWFINASLSYILILKAAGSNTLW